MTKYNEFTIVDNDLGEEFVAHVSDHGVHMDHNWMDGSTFLDHDQFDDLDEFRERFLDEIGYEEQRETMEVPVEDFAFWQSQMARASERATNDPEHDGNAVHRAHEQMYEALEAYHEEEP